MANVIQTFPAGAGGGHTILDSTGTAVAQEKNLKITGLEITDNPTDESTDLAPAGLNQDSIDDIAGASLPGTIIAGSGLNFSTTEQVIGRWIDGKPIYQKTWDGLSISISSSAWTSIVNVPNGHKLIDAKGYFNNGDSMMSFKDIEFDSGYVKAVANNPRTINILTIQYTKTTD